MSASKYTSDGQGNWVLVDSERPLPAVAVNLKNQIEILREENTKLRFELAELKRFIASRES